MHILLIDDHTLFREALIHVLEQLCPQVLVHEAGNVGEAEQLIAHTHNLDLVLLDIDLPGMDGLTALPLLRELSPSLPIVVLSGSESSDHLKHALDHGAVGYIPKSSSGHEMLAGLKLVLQGDVYIPPRLLNGLQNNESMPAAPCKNDIHPLLTARQIQVLNLMAQGLPNKSIAKRLDVAEGTVKLHVAAILRALDADNRTQAVIEATRLGLLQPKPD